MIKIILLFILILTCCSTEIKLFNPDEITKITIKDDENKVILTKKSDIIKFAYFFDNISSLSFGCSSCPFGLLIITFTLNNREITIYYATDDCNIFKYENNCYNMPIEKNIELRLYFKSICIKDIIY